MAILHRHYWQKKPLHFRDEIRYSFISYALIPSSIFTVLIISLSFVLWNMNISGKARRGNREIALVLEKTLTEYAACAENPFPVRVADMVRDKNALATAYSALKEFTARQEINANFAIIDPDFSIVMQGSPDPTFKIPEYQIRFSWGLLGRLQKRPGHTLIEISADYTTSGLNEILVGRALDDENNSIDGYIVFSIAAKDVMRQLLTISTPFIITDRYGRVFTSTSQYYVDQFGCISYGYPQDGKQNMTNSRTAVFSSPAFGGTLSVYTILDISQLRTAMVTIVGTTSAFLVLLIVGMVISASKIASQKSETIDQLVTAFRDVEAGILDNRICIDTNVEFHTIADAYNKMLDDINLLIEEKKREEKEKFLSELKQLEMQFNPHFLYNTLENIKYMVKLDPSAAQQTIVCLSEVLRYSIDTKVSHVYLEDDIKYIENYLFILKARFSRKFSFGIDISDSARKAFVPKLIVQPMIENSVKYGFDQQGCLDVRITVRIIEDRTVITVTDNGIGMEEQDLADIQELLRTKYNDTTHLGLYNVHRRIRLLYGDRYGVDIQSKRGYGTTVRVELPFRTGSDGTDSAC